MQQAIYVLNGEGTLRLGRKRVTAKQGDYFALLPGLEDSAHQMINTSSEPLRYLCFAIGREVEVCGYVALLIVVCSLPTDLNGSYDYYDYCRLKPGNSSRLCTMYPHFSNAHAMH